MGRDRNEEYGPLIPAVPAFATSGISKFFYYLLCSFLHLLGGIIGWKTPREALSVRRKGNMVLSQSCRCLFRILFEQHIPMRGKVLITPFHHHSFTRLMRTSKHQYHILKFNNLELLEPQDMSAQDFSAIIITHMLGKDFKAPWLSRWKEENPKLLIVEDRVQGDLFSKEQTDVYDVSLYSTGQDKLPNFMGGGFARVHSQNHPKLFDQLADAVEALPFESNWDRFTFLVKKIPTVLIYNYRPATIAIEKVAAFFGMNRNDLTDKYRKKNPGFMHGGYMIRPSPALIQAMETATDLTHWEEMQIEATRRYRHYLNSMSSEAREKAMVFGSDASCCYFFSRFPDTVESRHCLGVNGVVTISNQTFLPFREEDQHYIDHLIAMPSFFNLSDDELAIVAKATECAWNTVGKLQDASNEQDDEEGETTATDIMSDTE
eukprot:m.5321 g.5321  ORF g.5321 m.5321 type:complete len:433 (+) comp2381_c0_seq1:72-1370(+)